MKPRILRFVENVAESTIDAFRTWLVYPALPRRIHEAWSGVFTDEPSRPR